MADKTYTGATLEAALRSGGLKASAIDMVGMVKSSEKEGFIDFTRTDCESWVDLPVSAIEQAEHLGQKTCKDHSHPVFKLTLKEPKDPEARIFAALLASSSGAHHAPPQPPQGWPGPMPLPGQGSGQPTGPVYPQPQAFQRIRGGVGGVGGSGGLNAWGCWQSECCDCTMETCWPTGDGRQHCACTQWTCNPCTRCIWPY
jgi:hypothetical protein